MAEFDLKKTVNGLVKKISGSEALKKRFLKDPAGEIKKLVKADLADDLIEKLADAVKAKLKLDSLSGVVGDVLDLFD